MWSGFGIRSEVVRRMRRRRRERDGDTTVCVRKLNKKKISTLKPLATIK